MEPRSELNTYPTYRAVDALPRLISLEDNRWYKRGVIYCIPRMLTLPTALLGCFDTGRFALVAFGFMVGHTVIPSRVSEERMVVWKANVYNALHTTISVLYFGIFDPEATKSWIQDGRVYYWRLSQRQSLSSIMRLSCSFDSPITQRVEQHFNPMSGSELKLKSLFLRCERVALAFLYLGSIFYFLKEEIVLAFRYQFSHIKMEENLELLIRNHLKLQLTTYWFAASLFEVVFLINNGTPLQKNLLDVDF